VLRDGTQLYGRLTGATDHTITFRDRDGGVHTLDTDRLDAVRFDRGQSSTNAGAPASAGNKSADNRGYSNAPIKDVMALPAGTAISVRSNENINTQSATETRSYSAQVSQDVVDSRGNIAIPRGSGARLIVRRLGDGVLALDLQSVAVSGQRYVVDAGEAAQGAQQASADTARAVYAGSAFLGTLTGAIAAGGKGAAIGALGGGAVAPGTEIATSGPVVQVPASAILNFRLDNALSLRAAGK